MSLRLFLALLLLSVSPLLLAQSSIGLVPGQRTNFNLPANGYTTSFFIDVPAGATQFKVELESDTPNVDVDLMLRHGHPFSAQNLYGLPHSDLSLLEQSQYYSISGGDDEYLIIGASNYRPIRAGRWHLAVLNYASVPVSARLKFEHSNAAPAQAAVEVRFDLGCQPNEPSCRCNLNPWNDNTAVAPVGGNPGTTLGQQRRNAMLEAARRLTEVMRSEVPISIRACWDDLGNPSTGQPFTIAAAGPNDFFIDDRSLVDSNGDSRPTPFLPEKYAFFAAAPASRLAGTSYCRASGGDCANRADISIFFNQNIGSSGNFRFHLGYTPAPVGSIDFLATSVHELAHGLGFVSLIDLDASNGGAVGAKPLGRDDIYSRKVVDISQGGTPRPLVRLTDAQRASALVSGFGLQWTDPLALASPLYRPIPNEPGVRLFAPSPLRPGSTLSHLDGELIGELMTPQLNQANGSRLLGLAVPMLEAVGWDPRPRSFPTAPAPLAGQWYERDRSGHGIDFQRAGTDAAGAESWILTFYTYDQNGLPEWYLAAGTLIDGVFSGAAANAQGISLLRYRYQQGANPPSTPILAESGKIVLDFNQAETSAACNDGTERPAGLKAVMRWNLGGQSGAWCMEQLVPQAQRPRPDLTGHWYGPSDSGWGLSLAHFNRPGGGQSVFGVIYYADATGAGRWGLTGADSYVPGTVLPLGQRSGYCRTCPSAPTPDVIIGNITLDLRVPANATGDNRLSVDATYPGPQGGRFLRNGVPYQLLSAPVPSP